ncbi:MAG: 4'-phosphopantetheinyl transferase family protein [Solirubrobacteraceae bacterium]
MPGAEQKGWAPGPERPLLAAGAVHVWRAELTTVAASLGELLCEQERARAKRIANTRDGELWRRSRGLLRELLGRYLDVDPVSLQFVVGEHGKPRLADPPDQPRSDGGPPAFNMSHSGELAVYAFSDAGAVGVDVEVARRSLNEVAIAARMLGADEARRLQALDPHARQREFLRAWTCYEAELKCLGVGLGGREEERLRALAGGQRPWTEQLQTGNDDRAAAVATERPASELRCWEWLA